MNQTTAPYPFIFGAQYYRAPTPEPECWKHDLAHMHDLGFTDVKLWVQWRWSHRTPDTFLFDDVDRLMDLASTNSLRVTINTIFDVSPLWLFERYPDAKQVDATGRVIEPYTVSHRQIGGHPGPCYRHPGALYERKRFMAAALDHFRDQPALGMWDVWNEPEQSFQARTPDMKTQVCYCVHCRSAFPVWLQAKYGSLERLNEVWGCCYTNWDQVETPYNGGAITDFVDWREFHLDIMTDEAAWRLEMAGQHDPHHPHYLHVVPNVMSVFNSVTCVDDFALAPHCDVFAATMNGGPILATQVTSAARGKICYNVESHVNHGCTDLHQPILGLQDVLRDFLPQIGLDIKGFLFWQYRPEVLGFESPAWGVVGLDGADRPVTRAVKELWEKVSLHKESLMQAHPPAPQVGVWKSRRNEIFHFATQNSLQKLTSDIEGYLQALYWHNIPFRVISERMLEQSELEGLKLLIMPACYYLTSEEATALDRWVRAGGVLLCEAHLAAYNGTTGRHSRVIPGGGLAESWGIREVDSTSPYHLKLPVKHEVSATLTEDVRKALRDFGVSGGETFPFSLADGTLAWGEHRYAILEGDSVTVEGSFDGQNACAVSKPVGAGWVLYCGTNLGQAAEVDGRGLMTLLGKSLERAKVRSVCGAKAANPGTVHVDWLQFPAGESYAVVINRTGEAQPLTLDTKGSWHGIFTGVEWEFNGAMEVTIPASFVDLFTVKEV